jgi:hypothetical protein
LVYPSKSTDCHTPKTLSKDWYVARVRDLASKATIAPEPGERAGP